MRRLPQQRRACRGIEAGKLGHERPIVLAVIGQKEVHRRRFERRCVEAQPLREQRSEEQTSELQSLMRISYAVFCLKKKNTKQKTKTIHLEHITKKHTTTKHQ